MMSKGFITTAEVSKSGDVDSDPNATDLRIEDVQFHDSEFEPDEDWIASIEIGMDLTALAFIAIGGLLLLSIAFGIFVFAWNALK